MLQPLFAALALAAAPPAAAPLNPQIDYDGYRALIAEVHPIGGRG